MKRWALLVIAMGLLYFGCKKDEEETPPPPNNPQTGAASGTVTSNDSAHIATPEGAYIDVPVGAVPLALDSSTGTMIFTIEKMNSDSVTINNPPPNMTRVGRTYRFGPEGFVFARPVEIAIPVEGSYQEGQLLLARIDPTTGSPVLMSADYDAEAGVIKAQTVEMSVWDVLEGNPVEQASSWARIAFNAQFTPPDGGEEPFVLACVESFTPRFPQDTTSAVLATGAFSGRGRVWTLPQGTYTICFSFSWEDGNDDKHASYTLPTLTIENNNGWTPPPGIADFAMSVNQTHFDAATLNSQCWCVRRATPSPGTGELQVTLTWYNQEALDLDLWVTDPHGYRCYYGNTPNESGGRLDRDNACGNYQNGAPENIFWATAPNGIYLVQVDWYSECGNNLASQNYAVRVAGQGLSPITTPGLITLDQTVTVGQYELSGGALQQLPFDPVVTQHLPEAGSKKSVLN